MSYVHKGALLSADSRYRYSLWREWRGTHDPKNWRWLGGKDGAGNDYGEPKSVLFVMLNPSTADAEKDDATIRRCVGFAKAWKYERIEVVNLFAFRATKPKDLFAAGDAAYAPDNQRRIEIAAHDSGIIICAWGAHGGYGEQDETVRGWLSHKKLYALGFTKDGHPKHPLYLSADAQPVPMPE